MKRDFTQTLAEFLKDKRHRRQRMAAVSALSVIVVLGVALNLMQPAVTMTPNVLCGLEEHAHDSACYAWQTVCGLEEDGNHTHTDDCWGWALTCGLPEHTHTADCYPDEVADPVLMPAEEDDGDAALPGDEEVALEDAFDAPAEEALGDDGAESEAAELAADELSDLDLMAALSEADAAPAIEDAFLEPAEVFVGDTATLHIFAANVETLEYDLTRDGSAVMSGSAPAEPGETTWTWTPDAAGSYVLTLRARDAAGREDELDLTLSVADAPAGIAEDEETPEAAPEQAASDASGDVVIEEETAEPDLAAEPAWPAADEILPEPEAPGTEDEPAFDGRDGQAEDAEPQTGELFILDEVDPAIEAEPEAADEAQAEDDAADAQASAGDDPAMLADGEDAGKASDGEEAPVSPEADEGANGKETGRDAGEDAGAPEDTPAGDEDHGDEGSGDTPEADEDSGEQEGQDDSSDEAPEEGEAPEAGDPENGEAGDPEAAGEADPVGWRLEGERCAVDILPADGAPPEGDCPWILTVPEGEAFDACLAEAAALLGEDAADVDRLAFAAIEPADEGADYPDEGLALRVTWHGGDEAACFRLGEAAGTLENGAWLEVYRGETLGCLIPEEAGDEADAAETPEDGNGIPESQEADGMAQAIDGEPGGEAGDAPEDDALTWRCEAFALRVERNPGMSDDAALELRELDGEAAAEYAARLAEAAGESLPARIFEVSLFAGEAEGAEGDETARADESVEEAADGADEAAVEEEPLPLRAELTLAWPLGAKECMTLAALGAEDALWTLEAGDTLAFDLPAEGVLAVARIPYDANDSGEPTGDEAGDAEPEDAPGAIALTCEDGGVTATARYSAEAGVPGEAALAIRWLDMEDPAAAAYRGQLAEALLPDADAVPEEEPEKASGDNQEEDADTPVEEAPAEDTPAAIPEYELRYLVVAPTLDGAELTPEVPAALTLECPGATFFALENCPVRLGADAAELAEYSGGTLAVALPAAPEEAETASEADPEAAPGDAPAEPFRLTWTGEGCAIAVDITPDARISPEAALDVAELDGAAYADAALAALRANGAGDETLEGARCFRVAILEDGEAVGHPALPAEITFESPLAGEGGMAVIRADEAGTTVEALEAAGTIPFTLEGDAVWGFAAIGREPAFLDGQLVYEGADFTVTVTCGPEAALPAGTTLDVREFPRDSLEYLSYNAQAAEKLSENWDEVTDFARYFDITFLLDGEPVEPAAPVDVQIAFADAIPAEADTELQAIHFAEEAPELIPVESQAPEGDAADAVAFSAESFSVYGVMQTAKLTTKVITAAGETFRIDVTYGPEAGIPDGAGLTAREIVEGDGNYQALLDAATEAVAQDGEAPAVSFARFFDIEILSQDGEKLEPAEPVEVKISYDEALAMNPEESLSIVHFAEEGTEVIDDITVSEDGREMTYQQSSFSLLATLKLWSNEWQSGEKYIVLLKDPATNYYYALMQDGSLERASSVEGGAKARVNNPFLWTYEDSGDQWGNKYIYHSTDAYEFDPGNQLPTWKHYRYINPRTASGITTETGNQGSEKGNSALLYTQEDRTIRNWLNGQLYYLGGAMVDGKLKAVGLQNSSNAWPVYLAKPDNVPEPWAKNNSVNHIDISIEAKANIKIPLKPGEYYFEGNTSGVPDLVVTAQNPVIAECRNVDVPIDVEDIKNVEITAYTKDSAGKHTVLNDVFWVSGYTGNSLHEGSTAQVRLEGSFKVADLRSYGLDPIPDQFGRDGNGNDYIRRMRLNNKIYYSVSLTKDVDFTYMYNGKKLYSEPPTNPGAKALVGKTPLTLSDSFNYWDTRNECPPTYVNFNVKGRHTDDFTNGDILAGQGDYAMSGMDFRLGGAGEADSVGLQITKYVMDEQGHLISVVNDPQFDFNIFYNINGSPGTVINVNTDRENASQYTGYDGYIDVHNGSPKSVTVNTNGMASNYDLTVDGGMFYITEDRNSVQNNQVIRDTNGRQWLYSNTYFATEYVTRNGNRPADYHYSVPYDLNSQGDFKSIPEALGKFASDGINEDYLEFCVYNIYHPKTYPVKIRKMETGRTGANDPGLKGAEFDLYGPYTEEETNAQDFDPLQASRQVNAKVVNNERVVTKYTTGDDGTVSLGGLASGIYYLDETKAPPGYNSLQEPVKITVDSSQEAAGHPVAYHQSDNAQSDSGAGIQTVTGGDGTTIYLLTVTNSAGHKLPDTGSTGTLPCRLGGLGIMLISAMLYGCGLRRRREGGPVR